jgi:hypothetical protein
MMAAIDAALARVYPTRTWGEPDHEASVGGPVATDGALALVELLRRKVTAAVFFRAGEADELCDYVYVLCVGRQPALATWLASGQKTLEEKQQEEQQEKPEHEAERAPSLEEAAEESYLRIALSSIAPFAAVQEVTLSLDFAEPARPVLVEAPRSGVFSPALLKRFQVVVACLAAQGLRHLDFGDLLSPPEGFAPGSYEEHFPGPPVMANYLFFPQPSTTVTVRGVSAPPTPGATSSSW